MSAAQAGLPSPRSLRRALGVVLALPPPALVVVAGWLIDRLDKLAGDADLEPEEDACDAEDMLPAGLAYSHLPASLPVP